MSHTIKNLPKGLIELTFEIPLEEVTKELADAAKHITEEHPMSGYRPGKAPYDVVKAKFGEMVILEHALPDIVRRRYVKAVTEGHLHTYGQPEINVTKLAPGNPVSFTATVPIIPHIESLADFRKMKVEETTKNIAEKEVQDALKELQKMRTKEASVDRAAQAGDKIVVDMDLTRGGVALEGGQARDHGIYLDEDYYIPGMKEQVTGLKAGDKKSFSLKFPEQHFQKHLAGTDVDFALTVKEVFELQHPPLDDTFAAMLGQKDIATLTSLMRKNMEEDAASKEHQRAEIELLDMIVTKSSFGEIPDTIVNDEVERMIDELKHGVAGRGVDFADYLKNIGKTIDQLKLEMATEAMKRVKIAILMREVGERENIEVSDEELLHEVQVQINEHRDDAKAQERVRGEEYQEYLHNHLRNRKVLKLLGESIVKK